MVDDFYIKKTNLHAQSGLKLRKIRIRRHKTVKELSNACNVSEASIRYYESCERQLTDERMKELAAILDVDESALRDHQFNSVSDIIHSLFDLENAQMLLPVYIPEWDIYTVRITNSLLRDAVKEWVINHKSVATGEVDQDSYEKWKELYPSEPFQQIPLEEASLPFASDTDSKDLIEDYAYYALVTVLKIRQILTKNTSELTAFIDACAEPHVKAQYQMMMGNALGFIDNELGKMVEQAKFSAPPKNDGE